MEIAVSHWIPFLHTAPCTQNDKQISPCSGSLFHRWPPPRRHSESTTPGGGRGCDGWTFHKHTDNYAMNKQGFTLHGRVNFVECIDTIWNHRIECESGDEPTGVLYFDRISLLDEWVHRWRYVCVDVVVCCLTYTYARTHRSIHACMTYIDTYMHTYIHMHVYSTHIHT